MSDEKEDEVKEEEPEEENQYDNISPPDLSVAIESYQPDLSELEKIKNKFEKKT